MRYSLVFLSAVSLTIAAVNLRVWGKGRVRWEVVALAVCCACTAFYSWFEVALMGAQSVEAYGELMRWAHVPVLGIFIGLPIFLRLQLNAGRAWLMWSIIGIRILSTVINFAMPVNINFWEITSLKTKTILGEQLIYATGVTNPLVFLAQSSLVLLFIFSIDLAVGAWRQGNLGKTWFFPSAAALMTLIALTVSVGIYWGLWEGPIFASLTMTFVLLSMAYKVNSELRSADELTQNLEVAENELDRKLEAHNMTITELANVKVALDNSSILAMTDPTGKIDFVNRKFCEISKYREDELLGQNHRILNSGYHSKEFFTGLWTTIANGDVWQGEIRNRAKDGSFYWVDTTIVPFKDRSGQIERYVAIRHDVTQRKLAQQEAHELSAKLINAQERERARLARELHDDLSQTLALLSIRLQSLGDDPNLIQKRISELTSQIQLLSNDVHRISHELHPAKLNQLGLVAALRGFCREVTADRGIKVHFEATDIPSGLPNETSLCLYRVAQEAIQNIVKHSGASTANVRLSTGNGHIHLTVSDNGSGFDTSESSRNRDSLGLISMDERIRASGGSLNIESVIGSGTKLEAKAPLSRS